MKVAELRCIVCKKPFVLGQQIHAVLDDEDKLIGVVHKGNARPDCQRLLLTEGIDEHR